MANYPCEMHFLQVKTVMEPLYEATDHFLMILLSFLLHSKDGSANSAFPAEMPSTSVEVCYFMKRLWLSARLVQTPSEWFAMLFYFFFFVFEYFISFYQTTGVA